MTIDEAIYGHVFLLFKQELGKQGRRNRGETRGQVLCFKPET